MMGNDKLVPWQCNANNADSSTATESLNTNLILSKTSTHPDTYGYKQ